MTTNAINSYNLRFYTEHVPLMLSNIYDQAVKSENNEEIKYLEYEIDKWHDFKENLKDCSACNVRPKVDSIKSDIKLLKHLEIIDLTNNNIAYIDEQIKSLKKLDLLILTGNPIVEDAAKMTKLKKILPNTFIIGEQAEIGGCYMLKNKNDCEAARICGWQSWGNTNQGNCSQYMFPSGTKLPEVFPFYNFNGEKYSDKPDKWNKKDLFLFNYFKERTVNNLSDEHRKYYNDIQKKRENNDEQID